MKEVVETTMFRKEKIAHPYIPNSVPEIKAELMEEIGITAIEELYRVIPDELRLKKRLSLPEPLLAEYELQKHVSEILSKNKTCEDHLNFLGAGCYQHFIPAVCDEINGRSEFLTAYGGVPYTTLGRFQSCFEFQSQMGELLNMDVVGMPTYSWGTASGHAIRMASRLTGRNEVLIAKTVDPERLDVIRTFCQSSDPESRIDIQGVDYDRNTGLLNVRNLKDEVSSRTAAIYFENPTCLGTIEAQGREISDIAHRQGAISIVGVDPITLGVLTPPSDYGADIVAGTAQTLGVRMNCGGGTSGFIATRDEEHYVAENPLFLVSITDTTHPGEYAFGQCAYERTSYMSRERAKDWVGTVSGLWTITASVYMALMGPQGFRDLGRTIIQKTHYAIARISELRGVKILFGDRAFREFVVNFDGAGRSVKEVNKALLNNQVFGGKDLSKGFPELGNSALYCVTEMHTKNDIDRLVSTLQGVLSG